MVSSFAIKPKGECLVAICHRRRALSGVYCDRCRKRIPESRKQIALGAYSARIPTTDERGYDRFSVTSMRSQYLSLLGYSPAETCAEQGKC